jgi:hypothetical protein
MPSQRFPYFTDVDVKPTNSGQYAVSMFDKYSAPEYRDMSPVKADAYASPTALGKLNNFNVKSATAFVTNEKPVVDNYGNISAKETLGDNFWGSKTGNSSEGIRAIAGAVKDRAAALPKNEIMSLKGYTPELNNTYGRIAQKAFPKQYFKGNQGGNYIAPASMTPGVMRWLSRIMPAANLASIPSGADLYNKVKDMGPAAGYAKWLGFDVPSPKDKVY